MSQFSPQELLAARQQMTQEAEKEKAQARKAAYRLHKKCGLSVSVTVSEFTSNTETPWVPMCLLAIRYCEYDNFTDWLKERLEPVANAGTISIGIYRPEKGFWLNLGPGEEFPEGTQYYCYTSYYGAHESGY